MLSCSSVVTQVSPQFDHVILLYFQLFVYGRVMRCGAYALQWPLSSNVQTVILYIMKHLSSQVDVKYKQIAGDIGIVSVSIPMGTGTFISNYSIIASLSFEAVPKVM